MLKWGNGYECLERADHEVTRVDQCPLSLLPNITNLVEEKNLVLTIIVTNEVALLTSDNKL